MSNFTLSSTEQKLWGNLDYNTTVTDFAGGKKARKTKLIGYIIMYESQTKLILITYFI